MDDPLELSFKSTPAELEKIEQSDLCITLYTLWDRLRDRGALGGKFFYSCRNDSNVPDSQFCHFAQSALADCDASVDRGEAFLLSILSYDRLKEILAQRLHQELDLL